MQCCWLRRMLSYRLRPGSRSAMRPKELIQQRVVVNRDPKFDQLLSLSLEQLHMSPSMVFLEAHLGVSSQSLATPTNSPRLGRWWNSSQGWRRWRIGVRLNKGSRWE